MSRTVTVDFGPGSLECLTLKVWTSKREAASRKLKLRLEGTFTIYCGAGWEHEVDIDMSDGVWSTEVGQWTSDIVAVRDEIGDEDAARRIAQSMIEWELEAWWDPCDAETELD